MMFATTKITMRKMMLIIMKMMSVDYDNDDGNNKDEVDNKDNDIDNDHNEDNNDKSYT